MLNLAIDKLKEGMVVAKDIYSDKGQLLLTTNAILSNQMITQLACYGITKVKVVEGEMPEEAKKEVEKIKALDEAYIKRLLKSPSYRRFKRNYLAQVSSLEISFNDIVKRDEELDQELIIKGAKKLFDENSKTAYTLLGMLSALKTTDDSTYSHCVNVAIISRMIGGWLDMEEDELDDLTLAALLHDIGKCSVPPDILKKKGRLLPEEYDVMKMHTTYGYGILRGQDLPERVIDVALHHHERADGTGYPHGLKGNSISDFAAITAIADVYDAMTSPRVYRAAMCPFDVIATYERDGLQKYDARIIQTFLRKIADSYINCEVIMNDGSKVRIINTNENRLTRPMVQCEDGSILKLEEHPELYIQAIAS
ncbi:MAG: HD-GYP domain-containing protein [Lachnospiraceae bacterium]|nr:HD-GYP domain-containing protein [Lachnospiraceae bacterium]